MNGWQAASWWKSHPGPNWAEGGKVSMYEALERWGFVIVEDDSLPPNTVVISEWIDDPE